MFKNKITDKIIQGDCIKKMKTLPASSIDMVFADPPYNLQLRGALTRPDESRVNGVNDQWDKFNSLTDYDKFTRQWLAQARRLLKPDGTIWVIGTYHNIFRLGTALQNMGFWILNDIIWRKTNPMPNFRGTRFTNAHETLIWAARSPKSKYRFNYAALKTLNDDLQMRSDDWVFSLCTGHERLKNEKGEKLHATQKPESLVARAILTASDVGDVMLDPFLGSGTTACVARHLGRRFIGIERDENYVRAACARVRQQKVQPEDALEIARGARREARVPFGRIVEERLIAPGARLYDASRRWTARVRVDGSLICGRHSGSIHKLGAQLLQRESCNGWTFWHYLHEENLARKNFNEEKSLTPIDHLRQEMRVRLGLAS